MQVALHCPDDIRHIYLYLPARLADEPFARLAVLGCVCSPLWCIRPPFQPAVVDISSDEGIFAVIRANFYKGECLHHVGPVICPPATSAYASPGLRLCPLRLPV